MDLGRPLDAAPAEEVARWWAASYVSWAGAEPPAALAARLGSGTDPAFAARLATTPPPATYGSAEAVGGVAAGPAQPTVGGVVVVVGVETATALVVVRLELAVPPGGTDWRVVGATLL
jgi:hypothetical protein